MVGRWGCRRVVVPDDDDDDDLVLVVVLDENGNADGSERVAEGDKDREIGICPSVGRC